MAAAPWLRARFHQPWAAVIPRAGPTATTRRKHGVCYARPDTRKGFPCSCGVRGRTSKWVASPRRFRRSSPPLASRSRSYRATPPARAKRSGRGTPTWRAPTGGPTIRMPTISTLFGVLVVAFLLLNVLPGDAVAEMVGERADSATIARLRGELHLDEPIAVQFGHYLWGVVRGDLGRSYITQRPVLGDLAERFPKTLQLAGAAMLLAATCGITLGVLSGVRPGGMIDRFSMLIAYVGVSFPVYWVGLLLILLFAVALRWLPPSGYG